jgi:muconolactone delta-isomerase
MSVHSEEREKLDVPDDDGKAAMNQDQVESLKASATAISRELKALSEQVSSLMEAVSSLGPPVAERKAPVRVVDSPEVHEADDGLEMTVTVQPLPELAMAAVAETTLRSLPGVRSVKGVKREGDWAKFTLEVAPDTDLVTEMKAAMPVSFEVSEATSEAVSLDLKWAWGTD